jgi:hypothetical protein
MKKIYALAAALCMSVALNAQSFSDDFESYTVGNYLGSSSTDWTTWSGSSAGADDVTIVDDEAYSGTNSIYFFATSSGGGPDDVVLPFGAQYTTGRFQYEMMMYIPTGTGAYFNFQAQTTVGQEWALECTMNQDGDITISNTGGQLQTGTFTVGQWTRVGFDINLNQNEWEFYIDSVSQGSFSNNINKIASINIFAYNGTNGGNGSASFWVDDVSYEYTNTTLPNRNGAVTAISSLNGLVGQTKSPTVTIRNLGQETITAFDLDINYNGVTNTEMVTGISVVSYDEYVVELSNTISLVADPHVLTVTLKNVNGTLADDDSSDDVATTSIDPMVPGLNKKVVIEEATGTWCGWCPRGAVWMARMQESYPEHFIGLAVHNGDPMVYAEYDDGMGNLIGGYPSSLVDRVADIDPSVMEPDFLERVVLDASAELCLSASMDEENMIMTVTLEVTPTVAITNDWKVAVALSENGVTGTTTQWAQANYYSGGGSGELSGAGHDWHLEANPIPAANMEYDHVARVIMPSFLGMDDSFPEGGAVETAYSFDFEIPVSSDWDLDKIHVIGMLMDDNGLIDNGNQLDYTLALANTCGEPALGTEKTIVAAQEGLKVYPNPANDQIGITAVLTNNEKHQLTVVDVMGRVVFKQTLTNQAGLFQFNLDIANLNSGVYMIEMNSATSSYSTKFIKQ